MADSGHTQAMTNPADPTAPDLAGSGPDPQPPTPLDPETGKPVVAPTDEDGERPADDGGLDPALAAQRSSEL